MNQFFYIHLFSCVFMTGLIWIVQLIVYPVFSYIGKNEFEKIHQYHMNKITPLVAPIMSIELITGIYLYYSFPNSFFLFNLITALAPWVITFLINIPTHHRLNYQDQNSKINLINYNWPRTFIWSIRSIILIWYIQSGAYV